MRGLIYFLVTVFSLLFGLFIFLALTGNVHRYIIPTGGMRPTIEPGDVIFSENLSYHFRKPRRGEIICFTTEGIPGIPQSQPPHRAPVFIQRVIGLPGDKLELHNGTLLINDKEDPALRALKIAPGRMYLTNDGLPVQVPPDSYFATGDNTKNSFDSRYWGFLPATNLKGRAVFRSWPPSRLGLIK